MNFTSHTLQMWIIKVEGGVGVEKVTGFFIKQLHLPDKPMPAMSLQGGHKCIIALRSA